MENVAKQIAERLIAITNDLEVSKKFVSEIIIPTTGSVADIKFWEEVIENIG